MDRRIDWEYWLVFAVMTGVIVAIMLWAITSDIEEQNNQTQMMVLDDVMELRTEIIKLQEQLKQHDERPAWWDAERQGGE